MSTDGVNLNRRHFLTVATSLIGGVGAVMTAVPFVASMQPSARARSAGAPVEVPIDKLEPGAAMNAEWRGKAIVIVRRTPEMLATLEQVTGQLRDPDSQEPQQPDYARNPYRSIRPEVLVLVSICTHLGCSPQYRPEVAPADLGPEWKGGFFCPCHGSRFDLAGRVYKNVPAPSNLAVPPYRFLGDNILLIGSDEGGVS
ncbi:MAG TPA: ubiquinol-cytochrome c reductase iron-sulfur subunit [Gammaproteobacteria bacterium]|nr:ubiquinol-cytochrome c reductase iron-sulfur subunit [Gammaproteobacteria bacterium]